MDKAAFSLATRSESARVSRASFCRYRRKHFGSSTSLSRGVATSNPDHGKLLCANTSTAWARAWDGFEESAQISASASVSE
jgi:hypothetical protein